MKSIGSAARSFEFRPLQSVQRRCEAGIGEPLAQRGDSGLVRVVTVPRRRNLQAGIAEEAMNDPARRLADFEIVEKTVVAQRQE